MMLATIEDYQGDSVGALERVNVDRESAAGIVEAIREAMALAREQLPRLPDPVVLPRGIGPTVDLLRVLLKYKCEEADVAQRLVAATANPQTGSAAHTAKPI